MDARGAVGAFAQIAVQPHLDRAQARKVNAIGMNQPGGIGDTAAKADGKAGGRGGVAAACPRDGTGKGKQLAPSGMRMIWVCT